MPEPTVSILMNCYNSQVFLEETLRSVWSQTYRNWRLVFVDNRSTDRSAEIVREVAQGDSRLLYVLTPRHVPLGEAREYGLRFCDGEFIAFLDTDDLWLPEKTAAQIEAFGRHPEALLCYSSAENIDEKGKRLSTSLLAPKAGVLFGENLAKYEVNFQTVMLRRSVLDLLPPPHFDPALFYSPDYDLLMRVMAVGDAVCLERTLVRYRVRSGSLSEKTSHLWATEAAHTYRKLKRAGYIDRLSTPPQRFQSLARTALQRARLYMLRGRPERARAALTRFRTASVRHTIYWLACSLPFAPLLFKAKNALKAMSAKR